MFPPSVGGDATKENAVFVVVVSVVDDDGGVAVETIRAVPEYYCRGCCCCAPCRSLDPPGGHGSGVTMAIAEDPPAEDDCG